MNWFRREEPLPVIVPTVWTEEHSYMRDEEDEYNTRQSRIKAVEQAVAQCNSYATPEVIIELADKLFEYIHHGKKPDGA